MCKYIDNTHSSWLIKEYKQDWNTQRLETYKMVYTWWNQEVFLYTSVFIISSSCFFKMFSSIFLRIITGKNHPQIKLQRLQKVWIWTFGSLVHWINSLWEVLKLKQKLQKKSSKWQSSSLCDRSSLYTPFYLSYYWLLT